MRVTAAFFGLPRGHLVVQPSVERLLRCLRGDAEVRVVYHLMRPGRIANPRSGENLVIPEAAYSWWDEQGEGTVEAQPEAIPDWQGDILRYAGDAYGDQQRSVRNLLWQLHALTGVTNRALAGETDVVVFLRADLMYHSGVDRQALVGAARVPKACLIPDWHWWGGYNDRLAVCGRQSAPPYGYRLSDVKAFVSATGQPLQAECLLRFALRRAGVRVRTMTLEASRVRGVQDVVAENFNSLKTLQSQVGRQLRHSQKVAYFTAARLPTWMPWL